MPKILNPRDHSRESAGLTYVYPVVSRRAGGVSVGINLNLNNACNWRCIYCQVPNLRRGSAPETDLKLLGRELRGFLRELLAGDFLARRVPLEARRVSDIALSGNGEPTSAEAFEDVVALIGEIMTEFGLGGKVKLVLITNGSLVHRAGVRRGLSRMAAFGGEVWFKLDSATAEGMRRINGTRLSLRRVRGNLEAAAALCPTWLQTCVFALDGEPPSRTEREVYCRFVAELLQGGSPLQGVLLYGLARPSLRPEAGRLSPLPQEWMEGFAAEIGALGLNVKLNP